jgi:hypothetical protein
MILTLVFPFITCAAVWGIVVWALNMPDEHSEVIRRLNGTSTPDVPREINSTKANWLLNTSLSRSTDESKNSNDNAVLRNIYEIGLASNRSHV